MNHHYLPPVSQLLELGEAFARQHMDPKTWVRYDALGIGREHIEQLIAIVGDQRFHSDMAETGSRDRSHVRTRDCIVSPPDSVRHPIVEPLVGMARLPATKPAPRDFGNRGATSLRSNSVTIQFRRALRDTPDCFLRDFLAGD
jgi:hypothetical protein